MKGNGGGFENLRESRCLYKLSVQEKYADGRDGTARHGVGVSWRHTGLRRDEETEHDRITLLQ